MGKFREDALTNRLTQEEMGDYFSREAEDARFAAIDKRIEELEAENAAFGGDVDTLEVM